MVSAKTARVFVVMALRKIDNPRAVDLFHAQLEGLPGAEGDRLAHTLAGTDLLNAAWSLARKARASGDRLSHKCSHQPCSRGPSRAVPYRDLYRW